MTVPAGLGMWSAKTIVEKLAKKFPKVAPYINKAQIAGFLAPTILRKLFGKQSEFHTEAAERESERKKTKRTAVLTGLGLVGGLGAASLAGKGITAATEGAEALQTLGAGEPPPPGGSGGIPPLHGGSPTQEQQAMQSRLGNVAGTMSSQTSHEAPHLMNFISKQFQAGKSPEEIDQLVKQSPMLSKIAQGLEDSTGQPLLQQIKSQTGKSKFNKMPQNSQQIDIIQAQSPGQSTLNMGVEKPKTPSEKDVVMTPFGAGQVHKVHRNNAYVEVDGKLNKVPVDQLEPPEEDVIKAVQDILKIPEVDRSSNVALFVYDPDENKALFQFHDGSMYKYLDIDPQVVQDIAAKNATPITSGQNEYGAWSPDDPHGSLGAALWAYILKDPKYAKSKKSEPENPNYRKLQTLYDMWKGLRKKKKR